MCSKLDIKIRNGFSALEMIITTGLLGLVVIASTSVLSLLDKTSAQVENSFEYTSMLYEMTGVLNSSQSCTDVLAGVQSIEGQPITLTKTSGPNVGLQAGATYGKIKIKSLLLKEVTPVVGTNYRANIEVTGELSTSVFGQKKFVAPLPVFYSIDAGGKILHCEFDNPTACIGNGGSWTGVLCDYCINLGATRLASGVCQFPPLPVYAWQVGAWSNCDKGTQTRKVECTEATAQILQDDSICPAKKPSDKQACADFDWQVSSWSPCDKGSQSRKVQCLDLKNLKVTSDSDCSSTKPPSDQTCTVKVCPGGVAPKYCWAAGCKKNLVCYPKQECVQVCALTCPIPTDPTIATCVDGPTTCSATSGTIISPPSCP